MNNRWFVRLAAVLVCSISSPAQNLAPPLITEINPKSGLPGRAFDLQILGERFCPESTVIFGETELFPTVVSSTRMSAYIVTQLTAGRSGPIPVRVSSSRTLDDCSSHQGISAPVDFLVVPPITIDTPTLPAGAVGANYSGRVAATGGNPPLTFSVNQLPPGLALNAQNGQITGVPTQAGTTTSRITVTDTAGQSADRTYTIVVTGAPTITTSSLPGGTPNTPYPATTLSASGGTQPYVWSIVSGQAPGLTLSSAGVLSGTPTQAGTFNNVVIRVTDANGLRGERTFSMVIGSSPLQITTLTIPNGSLGAAYTQTTLAAAGGTPPYTWTLVGGAPQGLTLSPAGVLAGTPTEAGVFLNLQVRATDASGAIANRGYSITIINPGLQITTTSLPGATARLAYSTTLSAGGGGTPLIWQTSSTLPSGFTLSSSGVLSGTTQQSGPFPITFSVSDSTQTATRTLTLVVDNPNQCIQFPAGFVPFSNVAYLSAPNASGDRLVVGSLQPLGLSGIAGIALPNTPNQKFCNPTVMLGLSNPANVYQNVYVPTAAERNGDFSASFSGLLLDPVNNQPLPGGIIPTSRLGSLYAWRVGPQTPTTPLTITTTDIPQATAFLAYQTPISASGGVPPYTWSTPTGAPPGMMLDPTTGVLTGTPSVEGVYPFNVQVRDSANQTFSRLLQLVVATPLTITTATLLSPQLGVPYQEFLSVTGGVGPYIWASVGAAPPGLFVNPGGTITGTPSFAGTFNLTIRVVDSRGQQASRSYTMVVGALFQITNDVLPPAMLDTFYEQTFRSTGGVAPVTWQLNGSAAGLVFSSFNGVLNGFPTQSGTFFFTITAQDALGAQISKSFTLVVNQGLQIVPDTLPAGSTGAAYSQSFTATGGTPPYTFQISGTVPGLSLNQATLQGTPTQAGTHTFVIRVNDSTGLVGTKTYNLLVNSNLQITTSSLPDAAERVAYSQVLSASGGTPPYSWRVTTGTLPAGISLDAATGAISGTPTAAGSFSITIEVADGAAQRAARTLSLTVLPALTVQTAGTLASGTVGVSYTATLTAAGGTLPYTWLVTAGSLPDGTQLSSSGQINGTPSRAGSFTATVEATDAAGRSGSADINITINPALLRFTSSQQLPNATAGMDYQFIPGVTGGTPPYRWALAGAPGELNIDANSGRIVGRLMSTGQLDFSIVVTDSLDVIASQNVTLSTRLPANPTANISGLPTSGAPAQQVSPRISISQPYPLPLSGELNLTFESAATVDDPAIQFAAGGRRLTFDIPAGQTEAALNPGSAGIQTGTVAGTIRVTSRFTVLGTDVTPAPPPTSTIVIPRQAPVITGARVNRTATGFELVITAHATTREITSAAVRLQTTGNVQGTEFTVNLAPVAGTWYQSPASIQFGSLCMITIPFTIQQGTTGSVTSVSVSLTNSTGTSQPSSANF